MAIASHSPAGVIGIDEHARRCWYGAIKDRSAYLLEKSRQCRHLAKKAMDSRAVAILIATAESYEAAATADRRDQLQAIDGLMAWKDGGPAG